MSRCEICFCKLKLYCFTHETHICKNVLCLENDHKKCLVGKKSDLKIDFEWTPRCCFCSKEIDMGNEDTIERIYCCYAIVHSVCLKEHSTVHQDCPICQKKIPKTAIEEALYGYEGTLSFSDTEESKTLKIEDIKIEKKSKKGFKDTFTEISSKSVPKKPGETSKKVLKDVNFKNILKNKTIVGKISEKAEIKLKKSFPKISAPLEPEKQNNVFFIQEQNKIEQNSIKIVRDVEKITEKNTNVRKEIKDKNIQRSPRINQNQSGFESNSKTNKKIITKNNEIRDTKSQKNETEPENVAENSRIETKTKKSRTGPVLKIRRNHQVAISTLVKEQCSNSNFDEVSVLKQLYRIIKSVAIDKEYETFIAKWMEHVKSKKTKMKDLNNEKNLLEEEKFLEEKKSEDMQNIIWKMEKELNKIKEDFKLSRNEIEYRQTTIKSLKKLLENANKSQKTLQHAVEEEKRLKISKTLEVEQLKKNSKECLSSTLKTFKSEKETLSSKLATSNEENYRLKADLKRAKELHRVSIAEHDASREALNALKLDQRALETDLKNNKMAAETEKALAEGLRQRLEALQKLEFEFKNGLRESDEKTRTIEESLRETRTARESEKKILETKYKDLEKQFSAITIREGILLEEKKALEELLKVQKFKLEKEVEKIKTVFLEKLKETKILEEKCDSENKHRKKIEQDFEKVKLEKSQFSKKSEEEISILSKKVLSFEKCVPKKEKEIEILKKEISEKAGIVKSMKKEIEVLLNENIENQEIIMRSQEDKEKLKSDLIKAKSEIENKTKKAEESLKKLSNQKRTLFELEEQKNKFSKEKTQLEEKLLKINQEREESEKTLRTNLDNIKALNLRVQEDLEDKKNKLSRAQEDFYGLKRERDNEKKTIKKIIEDKKSMFKRLEMVCETMKNEFEYSTLNKLNHEITEIKEDILSENTFDGYKYLFRNINIIIKTVKKKFENMGNLERSQKLKLEKCIAELSEEARAHEEEKNKRKIVESEIKKSTLKIQQLQDEIEIKNKEIIEVEKCVRSDTKKRFEALLKSEKENMVSLRKELSKALDFTQKTRFENKELCLKIKTNITAIESEKSKGVAAIEELDFVKKNFQETKNTNTALKTQLEKLIKENSGLKKDLKTFEFKVIEAEENAELTSETILGLEGEISDLETKEKQEKLLRNKEIENLKKSNEIERVENLQKLTNGIKTENEKLKEELKTMEEELEKSKRALENSRKEIKGLREKYSGSKKDFNELKVRREDLEKVLEKSKNDINDLRRVLEEKKALLAEEKSSLNLVVEEKKLWEERVLEREKRIQTLEAMARKGTLTNGEDKSFEQDDKRRVREGKKKSYTKQKEELIVEIFQKSIRVKKVLLALITQTETFKSELPSFEHSRESGKNYRSEASVNSTKNDENTKDSVKKKKMPKVKKLANGKTISWLSKILSKGKTSGKKVYKVDLSEHSKSEFYFDESKNRWINRDADEEEQQQEQEEQQNKKPILPPRKPKGETTKNIAVNINTDRNKTTLSKNSAICRYAATGIDLGFGETQQKKAPRSESSRRPLSIVRKEAKTKPDSTVISSTPNGLIATGYPKSVKSFLSQVEKCISEVESLINFIADTSKHTPKLSAMDRKTQQTNPNDIANADKTVKKPQNQSKSHVKVPKPSKEESKQLDSNRMKSKKKGNTSLQPLNCLQNPKSVSIDETTLSYLESILANQNRAAQFLKEMWLDVRDVKLIASPSSFYADASSLTSAAKNEDPRPELLTEIGHRTPQESQSQATGSSVSDFIKSRGNQLDQKGSIDNRGFVAEFERLRMRLSHPGRNPDDFGKKQRRGITETMGKKLEGLKGSGKKTPPPFGRKSRDRVLPKIGFTTIATSIMIPTLILVVLALVIGPRDPATTIISMARFAATKLEDFYEAVNDEWDAYLSRHIIS